MSSKKTSNVYELGIHIVADDFDEKEIKSKMKEVNDLISKNGEIISAEEPERKELAYTIRHNVRQSDGKYKKFDEAFFGSIKFNAETSFVKELDRKLLEDESVLRFIILKTVKEDTRIADSMIGDDDDDEEPVKKERKQKKDS